MHQAFHIRQPITSGTLINIPRRMSIVYLNGKWLNEAKANISINNRSFRYGDGVFETIRLSNGQVLLWQHHWDRLSSALQTLQFQVPSFFTATYLQQQVLELTHKNGHQQLARIRLTIFRGNGGLYDPENHFPNCLIQSWPLNEALQSPNTNGLVIGIYQNGLKAADGLANLKSNNYLLYAMAALHARQQHWNDALVLNHRGTLADATIANLFILKDGMAITPPLSDGPVAGTMRRHLLEQLPAIGFEVKEQSLVPEDLLLADEVFLTNAIYGIKWVQRLEEKSYGCRQTTGIYQQIIQPLFHLA
jgi:branched-chain amino acid aminotransferase